MKNRRLILYGLPCVIASLLLSACVSRKHAELEIIPRSQWAPVNESAANKTTPMPKVSRITVHHDGIDPVTELSSYEQVRARVQTIRNYHLSKGWADIGYHYIVDPQGRVWMGRPIKWQGAHVSGDNVENIGIVMLGNFQHEQPTEKALDSLSVLIGKLKDGYKIPDRRVYTHKELSGKTECPGDHLQARIEEVR